LEKERCASTNLMCIAMIFILYASDIVLMVRTLYDLNKQLKILNDFFSTMDMIINTDKTQGYDNQILKDRSC